jgi:hypothetical protein
MCLQKSKNYNYIMYARVTSKKSIKTCTCLCVGGVIMELFISLNGQNFGPHTDNISVVVFLTDERLNTKDEIRFPHILPEMLKRNLHY